MHKKLDTSPVTWGGMAIALMELPAGADATPLLKGLPDDKCQCAHWGYVLKGSLHIGYADGTEEVVKAGDVFYFPPGHTGWTDEDVALLETLTNELGQTLERAQLYQDSQRRAAREQMIGEVTARIRETLDMETILQTAAREIEQGLGLFDVTIRLESEDIEV